MSFAFAKCKKAADHLLKYLILKGSGGGTVGRAVAIEIVVFT